jgi:hypothetical protein
LYRVHLTMSRIRTHNFTQTLIVIFSFQRDPFFSVWSATLCTKIASSFWLWQLYRLKYLHLRLKYLTYTWLPPSCIKGGKSISKGDNTLIYITFESCMFVTRVIWKWLCLHEVIMYYIKQMFICPNQEFVVNNC